MRNRMLAAAAAATLGAVALLSGPASAAGADQVCRVYLHTQQVVCGGPGPSATDIGTQGLFLVVRMWDRVGFDGDRYEYWHNKDSGHCSPELSPIEGGSTDLAGFVNRANSVKTFNQCDVKLFDGYNYNGAASVWIDQSYDLRLATNWGNRANSMRFS
jgi:hypothetical protein